MRLLVVRNPAAGRGRARRAWPAVARELAAAGLRFDEASSSQPGEAMAIAERGARDYDCLVAAGGDGTVHEVVNGLMRARGEAGAGCALGVIPLGSGDDFAKLLGPGNPVERLARGTTRPFDVGRIEADRSARWFANGMDIGFGAHGARNVRRVPGFLTGLGAYLGALVLTLVRYPLLRVRISIDGGEARELATAMTAVMNGTTFGGSFRVCPDARPDDGALDVLLVDAVGRLEILALVPKIMQGRHAGHPRLKLQRARAISIESDLPLLVEADGEIVFEEARRLQVELRPGSLAVLA